MLAAGNGEFAAKQIALPFLRVCLPKFCDRYSALYILDICTAP